MTSRKTIFIANHVSHLFVYAKLKKEYLDINGINCDLVIVSDKSVNAKRTHIESILIKYNITPLLIIGNKFVPFYGRNIVKHVVLVLYIKFLLRKVCQNASLILMGRSALAVESIATLGKNCLILDYGKKDIVSNHNAKLSKIHWYAKFINMLSMNPRVDIYERKNSTVLLRSYFYEKKYKSLSIGEGPESIGFKTNRFPDGLECKRLVIIGSSSFKNWVITDVTKELILSIYESEIKRHEEIYYIPHPLDDHIEFNELQRFTNKRINYVNNNLSTEFYVYTQKSCVTCLSIGSNASRAVAELGHCSKIFYNALALEESTIAQYNKLFDGCKIIKDPYIKGLEILKIDRANLERGHFTSLGNWLLHG